MKKLLLSGAAAASLALNPADRLLLPHVSDLGESFVELGDGSIELRRNAGKVGVDVVLERVPVAVEVGDDCIVSSPQGILTFLVLLLQVCELGFEAINQLVSTLLTNLMIFPLPLGHLEMLPSEKHNHDAQRTIVNQHLNHRGTSHNSCLCDLGLH